MSDEYMDDDEDKVLRQRKFYLYMSPFEGHTLAETHGNFATPSTEIMEEEIKATMKAWLTVQSSSIGTVLSDSAWWMLRVIDEEGRMGAEESMQSLDGLVSFGMSLLGQLLDLGLITINEEVDIPEVITSADFQLSGDDFEFLKQLESIWEEDPDNE